MSHLGPILLILSSTVLFLNQEGFFIKMASASSLPPPHVPSPQLILTLPSCSPSEPCLRHGRDVICKSGKAVQLGRLFPTFRVDGPFILKGFAYFLSQHSFTHH